ncbi:hypothetical protein BZG36_00459 [Bifiguratus adelaidae]|uniref:Anaphase-promoting complex subunit 4 WD40 domain-containing protein n=1 Tax=Bifiguratus adelaidae TaxID=1938954 RepID=A0A261Y7K8_9FUNG|nr:hypothetical protein BZG36_00459 [Bifiguratus adelaidae]
MKKYIYSPTPTTTRGQATRLSTNSQGTRLVYTNAKSVFVRDLENPSIATEYAGHVHATTAARFSPSGYYIASGDVQGNVRIWDAMGEGSLKSEIRPIAGRINDIAWDAESKRVIAVGDGKERFGHAFFFDSLSSCGEITGHSKQINSVSIKPTRPFKAVTASDDATVVFFSGVPYKFGKVIRDHSRFVQQVAFSPSGDVFCSVGADGKIFLYDGKEGERMSELQVDGQAHAGTIFAASWSPDSQYLLTSGADCTTKLWDVTSGKIVNTFEFTGGSQQYDDQQVGNVWSAKDHLVSLSLSGDLNYLDKRSGSVSRKVLGHARGITAMAVTPSQTLYTGSYDGRICSWDLSNLDQAEAKPIEGHANQVMAMQVADYRLYSVGMDDVLKTGTIEQGFHSIPTTHLPRALSVVDNLVAIATNHDVQIYDKGKKVAVLDKLNYTPTCAVLGKGQLYVGSEDALIRPYTISGTTFTPGEPFSSNRGPISAMALDPSGTLLAVADHQGKIYVYENGKTKIQHWVFHTGRVTSLAWNKEGTHVVSASWDTHIYVWSVERPMKRVAIKNAHKDV